MIKKRFLSMLVLLMTAVTGAWADDTYTVQFKANGNTKTVANVVLPHQFRCNFDEENGELDQIIKELYGWSRGYCCWEDISSSGNENVTCGSSNGEDYITISAPFEGTATVTGWYNPYSTAIQYSLEISIPGYVAPTVNVTGVSLSETTASMTVGGDALTLTATVAPDNATDKSVTWTTSDASVATVADGVVTAVGAGTATITATSNDDATKTATCTVTVSPAGYSVALKESTEDATNWQGKAGEGEYQSLPLTGLEAGTAVSVKYSGTKKVKSVKAVKKAGLPVVNGKFSVSDTKQVYFSKGNLRYASGAWSFFDNQYDYYTSYSADAWDKFGWSTSATTYGMNTSTDNIYSGDFVDWGATMGTGWFTLSSDEWTYLFNTRSASTVNGTANGRYAKAKVNNVQGMILFPDTYTHPDGVTAPKGVNATDNTGWNGNSYSSADWTKMESAGCVFLPGAGYREGSTLVNADTSASGNYWSATHYSNNTTHAYNVSFTSGTLNTAGVSRRKYGSSVRLVRQVTE